MYINASQLKEALQVMASSIGKMGNKNIDDANEATDVKADTGMVSRGQSTEAYSGISVAERNEDMMMSTEDVISLFRDNIDYLSDILTEEDLRYIENEGKSITDEDIDTIVTVADRIKIKIATYTHNKEIAKGVSSAEAEAVLGNIQMAYALTSKMNAKDVPVNEDTLSDAMEAVNMAVSTPDVDENVSKYILSNNLEVSIENVYKSAYVSQNTLPNETIISDEEWNDLVKSVTDMYEKSGIDVNEETLSDARWMIENNIPVTEENYVKLMQLRDIDTSDIGNIMDNVVKSMSYGKQASSAALLDYTDDVIVAAEAVKTVNDITDSDIEYMYNNGIEMNIANMKKVLEDKGQSYDSETNKVPLLDQEVTEESISQITTRRQLEELRLMMSLESAVRLMKNGIDIETESLSNLVEELKAQEEQYYRSVFNENNVEYTEDNVEIYRETMTAVEDIQTVPSYILGKVVLSETEDNISAIREDGVSLKKKLDEASERYDILKTSPDSSFGDSIKKAFANSIDSILADMGLDNNESNQRAVRILAYNNMEITQENMTVIKTMDLKVNNLMTNMTPAVALRLIKEDINPLNMDIDELNEEVRNIAESVGSVKVEKYSEFLYNLEKNSEITKEERDAYIGIYRIFNGIEKSDGSVIGALVTQGSDMTLKNLLSAAKSKKVAGMDYTIDDEFGGVVKDENIVTTTQLFEQGFGQNNNDSDNASMSSYYRELINSVKDKITPGVLSGIEDVADMTIEEFAEAVNGAAGKTAIDNEYKRTVLEKISELREADSDAMALLLENNLPVSINNLVTATNMLNQNGGYFKEIKDRARREENRLFNDLENTADSIIGEFTDGESAGEVYSSLAIKAEDILNSAIRNDESNALNISDLKNLYNGIQMMENLSKEKTYEIPVVIDNQVASMNVKIVSGEEKGIVKTYMRYGDSTIASEFAVTNNSLSGYIFTDNRETQENLHNNIDNFADSIADENINIDSIQIGYSEDISRAILSTPGITGSEGADTKALYKIAKAFIQDVVSGSN